MLTTSFVAVLHLDEANNNGEKCSKKKHQYPGCKGIKTSPIPNKEVPLFNLFAMRTKFHWYLYFDSCSKMAPNIVNNMNFLCSHGQVTSTPLLWIPLEGTKVQGTQRG